ncbi:MAG TPA: PLP-dependent aminotransferase family protein [Kofleriaceae bacterium]|jgi:DNA-binding transcriptional MocR family regulator|nr:PLP-dependent aminotransferase family protein [Kofleriaceae bacterium]
MVAISGFLYEHLADELGQAIDRGALRAGDRLPSVRRLAQERSVSVATVLEAYLRLENAGLIEVRPKSGHFVRRRGLLMAEPRAPRTCATPSRVTVSDVYTKILEAMRDPELVPFGCATIDQSYLPIAALNRIITQVVREMTTVGARYEAAPGLLTLRRQIARRAVDTGVALSERDVCTTIGATEALSLGLRAVARPGDVIAVESPAYFGVLQAIEGLGMRALEIPANPRTGLDVSAFEEIIKSQPVRALMVTPTISNPLGSIMPEDERERLVRITRRADIPVIEDDVYGELVFDGSHPRPLRSFAGPSEDSHVMLVNSVSKTLAPGYRVGWIAGGRWHQQIVRIKYSTTLSCPTLPGMAVAEFLASGGYDRHLRRLRAAVQTNVERYRDAIAAQFPEGTRVSAPRGGFVLWVELPPGSDALTLHEQALRKGIVIAPGPLFSARQRFANCIRISAGSPWSDRMANGIQTLAQLLARN